MLATSLLQRMRKKMFGTMFATTYANQIMEIIMARRINEQEQGPERSKIRVFYAEAEGVVIASRVDACVDICDESPRTSPCSTEARSACQGGAPVNNGTTDANPPQTLPRLMRGRKPGDDSSTEIPLAETPRRKRAKANATATRGW